MAEQKSGKKSHKSAVPKRPPLQPGADGIVRLTGGNPQIAKGEGEAKVREFIAAMPSWQQPLGEQMHTIIKQAVPGTFQSVKWNTPFYGTDPQHWFVSYHCMSKYIKVAFPDGASLEPVPPGKSKQKNVRYYDVYEDKFDADQFMDWVKQASALPGEGFS